MTCAETRQLLAPSEAERCGATGTLVLPGRLERCSVSGLNVLPSELERCSVSEQRALRKYLVSSSISNARILESEAVYAASGAVCTPQETHRCAWSDTSCHPDDLVHCALTKLSVHQRFATRNPPTRLQPLVELLNHKALPTDANNAWPRVAERASAVIRGRYRIEASRLSPDKQHLVVSAEVKTLLGLWVQHIGFVYAIGSNQVLGKIAVGKRSDGVWVPSQS